MVFTDDTLYACGEEGGGVAGLVRWTPPGKLITWVMPGGRQRAYEIQSVLTNTDEQFAFVDRVGRKFVLFPLTVDYYNDHVRLPGHPTYRTPEAMMAAYQESLR